MLSLILYTNRPAELTIALVDSDNADNNGVEVQKDRWVTIAALAAIRAAAAALRIDYRS